MRAVAESTALRRAQSIVFLRSLRADDRGATIYQAVVDDVLSELDETRAQLRDALAALNRRKMGP